MENQKKALKILYIDNLSFDNHIEFNRIQLNAMMANAYDVYCVFKKGYFQKLNISGTKELFDVPKCLYWGIKIKIYLRFLYFLQGLLIYLKTCFKKFDVVVFAGYDPVSACLFRYKHSKVFLFNHHNIDVIQSSKIKRCFVKHLPKHYIHLVFNEYMAEGLQKFGITNIQQQQQHEPVEPFVFDNPNIKRDLDIPENTKIIFSPSATSVDNDLIKEILHSAAFATFLQQNNLSLVLKGKHPSDNLPNNIVVIDRYLTECEYQNLFMAADVIFLPYDKNFRYRASGILFSAFVNNKWTIVNYIPAMLAYQERFNYAAFFTNIENLQDKILEVIALQNKSTAPYSFNIVTAEERWRELLQNNKQQ